MADSDLIDRKIQSLDDWRGATLARVRELIKQADPDVVEEVKWRKPSNPSGVPTWSHSGIICTVETYRDKVKLTFAQCAPASPYVETLRYIPEFRRTPGRR